MDITKYNNIHLIGIGGINVSAIAKLLLSQNKNVFGFDLVESDITIELQKLGANISIEEKLDLSQDIDLVIYSEAVPKDDKQREQANKSGIKEISAFEFWGEYAKDKKVIAVSGTNGKSSTTAILGYILEQAGFDPTVVVGTKVLQWNSNIRIGNSDWLVIEADEYHAHMLEFNPDIAIITNISADHLDFYKDIDDIKNHFQKWVNQIKPKGTLIINRDNKISNELTADVEVKKIGIGGDKEIRSSGLTVHPAREDKLGVYRFNIIENDKDWGEVTYSIPGEFNVANSISAAIACNVAGVETNIIRESLVSFKGTWRRFELVGKYNKADIVSDYAHHPDAIKATLKAARELYPFNKIIVLFEPHQHNRTKNLFDDFVGSFSEADEVIISEIYDVAGRTTQSDQKASSKDLVDAIKKSDSSKNITYAPDLNTAEKALKEKIEPENLVIVMGAGNVDVVARNLIK
jgi:UDP-N-acetylmuramate--alanine ligase